MDIFFYVVIPGMLLGALLLSIALGFFALLRYWMLPTYQLKVAQRREVLTRTQDTVACRSLLAEILTDAQVGRAALTTSSQDRIYELLAERKQLR